MINIKIIEKIIAKGIEIRIITQALPNVITFESKVFKPKAPDICSLILSDVGRHMVFLTI